VIGVADGIPGPSREWFRALTESSRDIFLVRDVSGALTYCSPAVEVALGYRPDELVGTNERELIHPVDLKIRDGLIATLLETDLPQPAAELRVLSKNGDWRWFETIDTNCLANQAVRGIVTNARDVTDRKAAELANLELVMHDTLTGLPNRLQIMDRLALALARAAKSSEFMAVLSCDLDDFKFVNDTVGHAGGDRVLVEIARRLSDAMEGLDTVARTSGDEFVVVCEGLADVEDTIARALRLRAVVEQPVVVDDFEVSVSLSIGIVVVERSGPPPTPTPMNLLHCADAALQQAKRSAKTRWVVFDESLAGGTTARRAQESELRRALERDEFVVHYQPVYVLADQTIVGVEALVRWEHPRRGLLHPADFIGLAEETGLIVELGAWVLRESCAQLRQWAHDLEWDGWMAVNLSARQLSQPGLAAAVDEVLVASALQPGELRLELTETALLDAGHVAAAELRAVRDLGVPIGLDDFGTGYGCLSNLVQLPIDFLKIDRSFVEMLGHHGAWSEIDTAIVAAVALMGRALDLETIAEGIETDEQASLLAEFGCPFGQGYRFARPAPPAEIELLLASSVAATAAVPC